MSGIVNRAMIGQDQDDPEYDNRVAMALKLLRQPQMMEKLRDAAQSDDIAGQMTAITYGTIAAVQEVSGPMDQETLAVFAVEILGFVSDAIRKLGGEVTSKDIAKAMYGIIAQYAIDNGENPNAVMAMENAIDFDAIEADYGGLIAQEDEEEPVPAGR